MNGLMLDGLYRISGFSKIVGKDKYVCTLSFSSVGFENFTRDIFTSDRE